MAFWRSKKAATDTQSDSPEPLSTTQAERTQRSGNESGGLRAKFKRTLKTDIRDLFKNEGRLVDEELLGELFARLIRTDMGIGPAEEIREDIGRRFRGRLR